MEKSKVIEALKDGVAVVEFTKVNGEYRKMEATLNEGMLPTVEVVETTETKTPRKRNDESLSVWDINAEGWRSFRWDKLLTVNGIAV